ncbi:MAG TPA: PAS domain S-box protein [Methylomirabilota bacterium]|nr:PAS domain S-box protein [Methylomirabilota bacterium]
MSRAVDRSEARYRELVESGRGLICTHDLAGTLLSVNRAAADRLGYAPEEMIGTSLAEYLAPSVRSMFGQYLHRIGHQPADEGLMLVVTRAGEERIWIYSNVRGQDESGLPYVLGHAQDVTDLKRSDARAVEAEALRSVAQLALATAHEINNPLTVIIGSLQLLLARGQISEETIRSLERVIRAAEQIRDTVRNMSRITRLELSRQSPALPDVLDLRKSSTPRA